MATVRVPPVLRSGTGGAREIQSEGGTVGEVLLNFATRYPSIKEQLFRDGELQRFVNVYLNDQDVQYLEKMETPVGPNDTLIILPAMAGG